MRPYFFESPHRQLQAWASPAPREPATSMQPRQQPLSEPGPRGPRPVAPLLALLLLLALQRTGAAPARPGESEKPEDYEKVYERAYEDYDYALPLDFELPSWFSNLKIPGGPLLPDGILRQGALAAVHFLNFREGSPSDLQMLSTVYRASVWETPEKEHHVDVAFTTERFKPEDDKEKPLGECAARVIFRKGKPRPAVNIYCEGLTEKNKRQQEDYLLYKHLKQLKPLLGVVRIPDRHGYIDPSLRPLWDLAALGSSYVMWDKTTSVLRYSLVQLTSVKQWKTDGEIDFDYTVQLHEFSTQEIIPCRIHLVWYPGKPLKVKYHCQDTPGQGSEIEEGSGVVLTELIN
ncbi:retinoic acid receptor responder protein 1 [Phyllostomus hastatus]|uniref:retinoic acid receptor responder protein 1 n=1 Tax=Phyllostomus hastatus TaxID=9423 RepID=UPI001E6818CC|nr:retinoic acid receptor responder protein 1 [Phyllostomus hastatus]